MQCSVASLPTPAAKVRWWRVAARIAVIGIITLVCVLVALEVGFRLMPHTIPLGACKSSPTLAHAFCQYHYKYDDPMRLGYVYKPGAGYDGLWNPADPAVVDAEDETCSDWPDHTFRYAFRADEKGFVNTDFEWQDHYDIIATGDSFSMSFAPVWWLDLLGEQTGMSTLNLGMDGWGTLSEVESVRMYGLSRKPQWVILLYFEGNDLFNVEEYQRRRESGMDWRTYELHHVNLIDRLVLSHVLRYWWDELWGSKESHLCRYPMTVSTNVNRFETIFFYPHISALSAWREEIEASEGWALATQAILDLRDEVVGQDGRFLLVYVPAKERLYWRSLGWNEEDIEDIDHFLALTTPLRSYQEFDEHVDDQMMLMEEFVKTNDIEFINLSGELWQRTMLDGVEYYNYADVHWNEAGNRLVAQVLADFLNSAPDSDGATVPEAQP